MTFLSPCVLLPSAGSSKGPVENLSVPGNLSLERAGTCVESRRAFYVRPVEAPLHLAPSLTVHCHYGHFCNAVKVL